MSRSVSRSVVFLAWILAASCSAPAGWLSGQSSPASGFVATTKNGEWQSYTGDTRGSRYSPLDQITAQNFNDLEVAWRFKTDSLGTRPEYKLEGTPLMIGGVLYATAGTRRSVIALDAATGELLWVHRYPEGPRGANAPRQLSGRGPRILDRRTRRSAHPLRHPGLSPHRAQRKDRAADSIIRHQRRRRSEGRRGVR